jgi:hypothetical protein
MRLHGAADLCKLPGDGCLQALAIEAKQAPNSGYRAEPAGGGGAKETEPPRDARPRPAAMSTPTATAVMSSAPLTPPRVSAATSAAGNTLAMACTTAPSCKQSNS